MVIAYQLHHLSTITRVVAVILGFFSFALSLASQSLLKDLLAGLLILWEDQYAVGDVIVIGEQGGLVESISLRVTKLRNLEGELITIPNGSIGIVSNLSSEWSRVNYAIEVDYHADIDLVLEVFNQLSVISYQLSGFNNSIARQRGLGLCPSGATVEGGYGEETSPPLSFN